MDDAIRKYLKKKDKKKKKSNKKRKEVKLKSRDVYDIRLSNFQIHLYECLFKINGIPSVLYMYVDGESVSLHKNVKINDKFMKASKLDWKTPADINSMTFRGRFATLMIYELIQNSHAILKHTIKKVTGEDGVKYKVMNKVLDDWIVTVDSFIACYLSSNLDYTQYLHEIYQLLLIAQDKDFDIYNHLMTTISLITEARKKHEIGSEGVIVNNLTKMAYAIATDSTKVKRTPKYNPRFDFRDDDDVVSQVMGLGDAILHFRAKKDTTPALYQLFLKANPLIESRFEHAANSPELVTGLGAIMLVEMFLCDADKKYVEKIR